MTEFAEPKSDLTKKIKSLNDLKNKVSSKKGTLTESGLLIKRIDEDLKSWDSKTKIKILLVTLNGKNIWNN